LGADFGGMLMVMWCIGVMEMIVKSRRNLLKIEEKLDEWWKVVVGKIWKGSKCGRERGTLFI